MQCSVLLNVQGVQRPSLDSHTHFIGIEQWQGLLLFHQVVALQQTLRSKTKSKHCWESKWIIPACSFIASNEIITPKQEAKVALTQLGGGLKP